MGPGPLRRIHRRAGFRPSEWEGPELQSVSPGQWFWTGFLILLSVGIGCLIWESRFSLISRVVAEIGLAIVVIISIGKVLTRPTPSPIDPLTEEESVN